MGKFHSQPRWQRFRAAHLRKEPLCRSCFKDGRIVVATEVDHIVRITDGGAPLDHDNCQSLAERTMSPRAQPSRR